MSILEEDILHNIALLSKFLVKMDDKLNRLLKNNTQIKNDKLLDNQDMCLLLKVTNRTLQRYRNAGILPFATINRRNYYLESDVYGFIKKYFEGNTKFKRKQLIDEEVREDE